MHFYIVLIISSTAAIVVAISLLLETGETSDLTLHLVFRSLRFTINAEFEQERIFLEERVDRDR